MTGSPDQRRIADRFIEEYAKTRARAVREVERAVAGYDAGVNGYTTIAQANALAHLLNLAPDDLLLDVASGRGWPGSYIARSAGCNVVLTDIVVEALKEAPPSFPSRNGRLVCRVAADGTRIPLAPESVTSVVHADAFC